MSADVCKPAAAVSEPEPERVAGGRWALGSSGNPGGKGQRERNVMREVREAAGRYAPEALKTLVNIMRNRRVSHATRIAAASAILDRAVGKASAPPAINFDDGSPVPVYGVEFTDIDIARRIAHTLAQGLRALAPPRAPPIDAEEESGEGEST